MLQDVPVRITYLRPFFRTAASCSKLCSWTITSPTWVQQRHVRLLQKSTTTRVMRTRVWIYCDAVCVVGEATAERGSSSVVAIIEVEQQCELVGDRAVSEAPRPVQHIDRRTCDTSPARAPNVRSR